MTSPYLLLSLSALFWAGNYVVGRAVRFDVGPVTLAFWRDALACLLVLPFAWRELVRHWPTVRAEWASLFALGATGVGGYHICVYMALSRTEALNAALLLSAMPVTIVAASWLVLGHRVSAAQALGLAVSLLGVVAVIARGDLAVLLDLRFNRGDLWMLAGVPLWTAYSVLLIRRPIRLPSLALLAASLATGVAAIAPVYAWAALSGERTPATPEGLAGLFYVALFATLLGYWFWNLGVGAVGASRAGSFIHLTPVFAAILSIILLGERIAAYHLLGAALVFGGIVLVSRGPAPAPRPVTADEA